MHLAANTGVAPSVDDPIYDCKSNVLGTLNLLECARIGGIDRFVFASSGAPIGEQEPPISESIPNPLHPMGPGLPVRAIALLITKHLELLVALRFGNVYGPGQTIRIGRSLAGFGQAKN